MSELTLALVASLNFALIVYLFFRPLRIRRALIEARTELKRTNALLEDQRQQCWYYATENWKAKNNATISYPSHANQEAKS